MLYGLVSPIDQNFKKIDESALPVVVAVVAIVAVVGGPTVVAIKNKINY